MCVFICGASVDGGWTLVSKTYSTEHKWLLFKRSTGVRESTASHSDTLILLKIWLIVNNQIICIHGYINININHDISWNHNSPQLHFSLFNKHMCTSVMKGALWDMEQVHSGICELGQLVRNPRKRLCSFTLSQVVSGQVGSLHNHWPTAH